jgi:alpha-ribazole phosphatase
MRLALIRHGAASDTAGRCIGHTDAAISPAGLAAVQRLASAWFAVGRRAILAPPARIIASDLARARASAGELAAVSQLSVEVEPRLREIHFGRWDGLSWQQIEHDDGVRLAIWMDEWVGGHPPGGESFSDLQRRVECWYEELCRAPGVREDETIAVVTHAGVVRALLCNLLGWHPAQAFETRIDPASVSGLSCQSGRVELLFLNADRVPTCGES